MQARHTTRNEPGRVHERPPDPAEAADRPMEPKARPHPPSDEEGREPGAGTSGLRPEPPHHRLNNPVGEPDPTADSDPYQPDLEAGDFPPPGRFPGPGPEPQPYREEGDEAPLPGEDRPGPAEEAAGAGDAAGGGLGFADEAGEASVDPDTPRAGA